MNELDDGSLQQDLEFILSKATYLIETMLMVTQRMNMEFAMRNIPKRVSAKTANTIIAFSQNLVQGMWYDDEDFMQLPFVDYERIKNFKKKNKNVSLEQYCRLTTEERRAMALYEDPKQFEDCEKTIKSFPVIDVNCTIEVEGEKDIAVGDLLTIKIQITHLHLNDKQSLGFVHSNKFPYLKKSSWYMVLTDPDDNVMMGMDKLVIGEKVHVKEMKERMTRPGTIEIHFHIKNDSYRGFDKKQTIKFTVLKEVTRQSLDYNEEDLDAQKAPSLMQSMMEMNPDGGDSDDELSEDENTNASNKAAADESKKQK